MAASDAGYDGFQVERWVGALGGFISRRPRLWIALGNLETRLLSDEISSPESSSRFTSAASLAPAARSCSRPWPSTRIWSRTATATIRPCSRPTGGTGCSSASRSAKRRPPSAPTATASRSRPRARRPSRRSSGWRFFRTCTTPRGSDVLGSRTSHPEFEAFYRDHIRKLMLVRGGERYLSKGNYNVTRLEYLLKLFPDARFVIPVREPVWHIASLMKQHALFCKGETRHPAALRHMRQVGHFEFGLDRRPINAGDADAVARTVAAWERGDEVEGWARYWITSIATSPTAWMRTPISRRRAGGALRGHVPRAPRDDPSGPDSLPAGGDGFLDRRARRRDPLPVLLPRRLRAGRDRSDRSAHRANRRPLRLFGRGREPRPLFATLAAAPPAAGPGARASVLAGPQAASARPVGPTAPPTTVARRSSHRQVNTLGGEKDACRPQRGAFATYPQVSRLTRVRKS